MSDLYVSQIQQFKPTPVKPSDVEGAIKSFTLPPKPSLPTEEITAEGVASYEALEVETEATPAGEAAPAANEDWFVFEEEAEHH